MEGRGARVINGQRGNLCGERNGPAFTAMELRTLATYEDQEHGGNGMDMGCIGVIALGEVWGCIYQMFVTEGA